MSNKSVPATLNSGRVTFNSGPLSNNVGRESFSVTLNSGPKGRIKSGRRDFYFRSLHIVVEQKEGVVFEISFAKNPNGKAKESRYGEYVLRTNRLDLTDEEISKVHRSLTTVEASFRSMKSELGLRPNYHKRDEMTIAHIFITVIGYHFLAGILKKLRAREISYCWDTVRKILLSHIRVSSTFSRENGDTVIIRNSTTPTPNQQEIYNCLKIKQTPLKRINTIIPVSKNIETSK